MEELASIAELCGTSEIPCPLRSRPSSPSLVSTRIPSTSQNQEGTVFFTEQDYVDSDEELGEIIAQIRRQEEAAALVVPKVRYSQPPDPLADPCDFRQL
jgi:hypothetical protein